jgi:modulator of FtsH protease HflK
MENVLRGSNKVIVEQGTNGGQGVIPYLPLPELRAQQQQQANQQGGSN